MMQKLSLRFLVSCFILLNAGLVYAQGNNEKIARAHEQEDLTALIELYSEEAVLMPEFHPVIHGKKSIASYFKQRFRHSDIHNYTRTMHSYEQANNYMMELGTFSYRYTLTGKDPIDYTGKYLLIWQADKKGKLRIVSEIWGSDKQLERTSLAFTPDADITLNKPKAFTPTLEEEKAVQERNDFIATAVKNRDGVALATVYDANAIYMPYYSKLIEGHNKIKDYYIKHEDKNVTIDSVSIRMSAAYKVKNYLVVHGYYGVRWLAGEYSGLVTGKSINIWRRTSKNEYLLYRQMVNHD